MTADRVLELICQYFDRWEDPWAEGDDPDRFLNLTTKKFPDHVEVYGSDGSEMRVTAVQIRPPNKS